jgi:predicted RNase H-like nuclease (RuvC/YqgF family)
LNTVIHQEEDYFNAVIEKINQNIGLFTDENNMRQFVKMIASFRSIISGRASLNSLRNAVASRMNDAGTNGDIMTSTETADERERRVRSIEATAKDAMHTTDASREHTQEIAVLKENINDLENKVASLTAVNDDLKQVNKRLSKEQAETKIILKKARNLQERIDMLNAEIQLTRVDCNLLKMDAVATDYDASQKKRLISESSSILASLSGSDNAAIRRKAKDKVALLNHIAGARE